MPDLGVLSVLLALAGAATWAATTLAARLGRLPRQPRRSIRTVAAWLCWIVLLLAGSLVAGRMLERIASPVLGAALFAALVFALSLAHGALLQRRQADWEGRSAGRRRAMGYALFLGGVLLLVLLAAFPIVASDLFRKPYAPAWRTINRVMDRLSYTYNPSGGGQAPSFPPWRNPGDAGLAYSDVALTTSDGLHLAAWFVPGPEDSKGTVLLAHGLQDSKWTLLRLFPWLHEGGYHILALDLRGHGQSDKRPTTLGPEEALDVEAALDWLQGQGLGDRVVGLGQSLGAAALANASVRDARLKGLILDSLFAEWKNVDYARSYHLPPEWLVPGVPDPVDLLRRVRVPVLIIHGTADNLVHVDHAERLYAAANEPKQVWINDSGHAWSAWTYPEVYRDKVLAFLDSALQAAGQ